MLDAASLCPINDKVEVPVALYMQSRSTTLQLPQGQDVRGQG